MQPSLKREYAAPKLSTYGKVKDLTGQSWTPYFPDPSPRGNYFQIGRGQTPQPFSS